MTENINKPSLLVRLASNLPFVKQFRSKLLAERRQCAHQLTALQDERDQLLGHCARLERELAAANGREEVLKQHCDALLQARDMLEKERNHLYERCRAFDASSLEIGSAHLTPLQYVLQKMRVEWDDRARINAAYYTNSATPAWDEADYFETGEANVREQILNDMENICQGRDPKTMRVIEIGCGAGRVTLALSRLFGEVHAVDISSEMIRLAKAKLSSVSSIFFYQNNGMDLNVLPEQEFDFIFSFIVFQHIPSKEVIESYVREARRLLKPGSLFKLQLQGEVMRGQQPLDTWLGAAYTPGDVKEMAARCGFEARYMHGAGTQYFWVWLFRE